MFRLNRINFDFVRSRLRKQIQFDPKLKNYANQQSVRLQKEEFRQKFEKVPTHTFTDVLKDPNPKPGQRFHVRDQKLNKKIKQIYKQHVNLKSLQAHDEDDLDYLAQSKSHLFDQKQQIQFQQKFKQQLFRSKQTKRLIAKKEKQINNYIPDRQRDQQYLKYEEAKKTLKNKKISNMMSMNRNNEQLQLLIQSGLFNDPNNIKSIIEELTSKNQTMLQHHPGNPSTQTTEIVERASQQKQISDRIDDIGPEQLKQRHKIVEFMEKYDEQHQKDKQSCLQDLNLLKQIRQYQQKVFLSRYEAINFRFKGRVKFDFFREIQLINYIKNQNIQPKDLLVIFKQNQKQISKFNLPIMTPPVVSTIYCKTCLYKFPQTDTNNKINMLNDPLFQRLERSVFKNIQKLNDTDFCSVIWAYADNHSHEQGYLKIELSNKINQVIAKQLSFRIYNLNDQDLGLCLRAALLLKLQQNQNYWKQVVDYLQRKVAIIQNDYTLQSVFQFLCCLPPTSQIAQIVASNIQLLGNYKWQQIRTILSFVSSAGLVLRYKQYISKDLQIKQIIKDIIIKQEENLFKLLPFLSINNFPNLLVLLKQVDINSNLPKLVNLSKKLVVDNIRAQKQSLKQYNVPNLLGSFALIDIQKYEKERFKKIIKQQNITDQRTSIMRKICIKYLVPFQPVPYNSSNYFIYHELATFAYKQMNVINSYHLSQTLEFLSLVKYKNERLTDQIAAKVLESIQTKQNIQLNHNQLWKKAKKLGYIICSYSLQRRYHANFQKAVQLLLSKYYSVLIKLPPNYLLRLASAVLSIDSKQQHHKRIQIILSNIVAPIVKSSAYIEEQLAALAYCAVILNNYNILKQLQTVDLSQVKSSASKFIILFSQYLQELTKKGAKQACQTIASKFKEAQKAFFNDTNQQILYNEECVGSPLSQKLVYEKVHEVLKQRHNKSEIIRKNWFLEIKQQKIAYFIATYDHLMVNNLKAQSVQQPRIDQTLSPFGVWRLYQKYYSLLGWEVKVVVSFLEGK